VLSACLAGPAQADNFALRFGEGDSVKVADAASLDLTGPFTVEAWVKADATIYLNYFKFIVSKQLDGTGYTLLGIGNTGFQFESFNVRGGPTYNALTNSGLFVGNWTHVAGVFDGSLNSIYVNGVLTAINPNPFEPVANNQDLYIGGSVFGADTSWDGLIDEVRVWSYDRGGDQLRAARFVSFTAPQPGLVGYWKFDEGSGLLASDSSGYGNHGVLDPPVWTVADDLVLQYLDRDPAPVPEPSFVLLAGGGCAALLVRRRRRASRRRG
jgi:hypothetical protein